MVATRPVAADDFREVCWKCRRAQLACICSHLTPLVTKPQIALLQHPKEARNPIGTARMAHLQLSNSLLVEGMEFHNERRFAEIEPLLKDAAVLFPGASAQSIDTLHEWPQTVFVIDGTWSQARKLWKQNPWLKALPQLSINPIRPGEYQIRKEPELNYISTIEAIGYVLQASGSCEYETWLRPFRSMIGTQLDFAAKGGGSRHRRELRVKYLDLPVPLRTDEHTVVVHAEVNGWPRHMRETHPLELLHWVAHRPSTGECFDVVIKPTLGFAPRLDGQLLSDDDLAGAVSFDDFFARWQSFIKPDDAFVSWGCVALQMLRRQKVTHPPVLDLQRLLKFYLGKRLGRPEEAILRLGLSSNDTPASRHRGRAGFRLAQIEQALAFGRTKCAQD